MVGDDPRREGEDHNRSAKGDIDASRLSRVQKAVSEWTRELIDLGGRNNLLHYRELKRGTLELTSAEQGAFASLLGDRRVRLSSLFGTSEEKDQAIRRARVIYAKAKENLEERGIETLYLGCGLASWDNKSGTWEPAAPVLLRPATLRPVGAAQDEFELRLVGDMEVNPTLLHLLKVDFDCDCDEQALLATVAVLHEPSELQAAYDWLKGRTTEVKGFAVQERLILANFSYAKLPMVRDLENALDELAAHDIIAAIAGDEEARSALEASALPQTAILSPDYTPLADEFLILDADASQNYAINAALAGQSLIVKGPPGTGKSQSIANLISALIARGQRVLFVAEKRAAVDAVLKRLEQRKLADLVMDLHGRVASRRAFAQNVGAALAATRTVPPVDFTDEQRRVELRRDELNGYVNALHEKRAPWDMSVYDMRAELLGISEAAHTQVRLRGETLDHLDAAIERHVREDLASFTRLGGIALSEATSPWTNAKITRNEEVQAAYAAAQDLAQRAISSAVRAMEVATRSVTCPTPVTLDAHRTLVAFWGELSTYLTIVKPEIFALDLRLVSEQLAHAAGGAISRHIAPFTSRTYRSARRQTRALLINARVSDRELREICLQAREQLDAWHILGATTPPAVPQNIEAVRTSFTEMTTALGTLHQYVPITNLGDRALSEIKIIAEQLVKDRATAVKLPELRRLEAKLLAVGLEDMLADLKERRSSEAISVETFRYIWLISILDHLALADPIVGGFVVENHEQAVGDFKSGDRKHIETTAARIRRLCAERATAARDDFREQAQIVQRQANLKRGRHMPVRTFFQAAPDVLLALKPCWIMSPLGVSQLLPPTVCFDVVVFDEASQITPADAVPSILRGKQVVVAGDQQQLPPTAFFVSETPDDEDDPDPDPDPAALLAGTKGFESILDALSSLLPFRTLGWHYRSRDERLIAFSNAHIYDRMLTTFAGVGGRACLQCVLVEWEPGADTNSPTAEVTRVVDLVLDHARTRPDESLGVIAMGVKHANRIQEALRQRLHNDPELANELTEFFNEDREESFFAKNLERVQGDERDAMILSIGYGKNQRGELVYRFGPLNTEGGERRLNVAITRAKARLTLVSSFSGRDMDVEKCKSQGMKLLRQYLQYIESGGDNLGDVVLEKPALNPFEIDVRDTLSQHGLRLTPQHGSSGYWIDFAVQRPDQPGRYVLAIECDGAMYHSSQTARDRDRLRQEHLERLGWRFHRIWSTDWFYAKEKAVEKVIAAYEHALDDARDGGNRPKGHAPLLVPPMTAVVQAGPQPSDHQDAGQRGPRPYIPVNPTSYDYDRLIRWIESDHVLRTEDELVAVVMSEVGFKRRGKKIVSVIRDAISRARR